MRLLSFLYLLSSSLIFAQEANQDNESENSLGVDSTLFDSSFFSGVLDQANESDDAMGTQRLIDLRGSTFSPSINFSTNYNYSSNPLKAAKSSPGFLSDGFTTTLNLMFALGLGDWYWRRGSSYSSLSLAQMRTYTDPVRDYGNDMKAFDVDVQIASIALPLYYPTISHYLLVTPIPDQFPLEQTT